MFKSIIALLFAIAVSLTVVSMVVIPLMGGVDKATAVLKR